MSKNISAALKSRLTFANAVALLALFVALGGTSVAAIALSKNSVRSQHIAGGAVKQSDIARSAVNSAKVANGSLLETDFKAGQLPAGPKGDKGDKGDRGQAGLPGTARAYALGGISCGSAPAICALDRSKGVESITHASTGVYCVRATGIDASDPDSVAVVSLSGSFGAGGTYGATWRSTNTVCPPTDFEVETRSWGTINVRNAADTGSTLVLSPSIPVAGVRFTIAVL